MLIAHLEKQPLDFHINQAIPPFQENDRYEESLLGRMHTAIARICLGSVAITALSFALACETDKSFAFPNTLFISAQTQQSLRRIQKISILVGALFFAIACISGWITLALEARRIKNSCAQRTEYLKAQVLLCKNQPLQEALKRLFVLNQRYIQIFLELRNQSRIPVPPNLRSSIQAPLKELCFELAAKSAELDDLTALDLLPIGSTESERAQWLEVVKKKCNCNLTEILIDRRVARMPRVIAEIVNAYASPLISVIAARVFCDWSDQLERDRANALVHRPGYLSLVMLPPTESCVTTWAWGRLHPGQQLLTSCAVTAHARSS